MPRIILPGNYQSIAQRYIPPDEDSLEYWAFLGGDAEFSSRNHASGKQNALIIGSPVYSDNFAQLLPGSNYIQTQTDQSDNITIIAVARPTIEGYTYLASNATGPTVSPPPPTTRGVTFRFETGAAGDGKVSLAFNQSIKDVNGVDQEASATRLQASVVGSFSFLVGRCDANTGTRTARDLTTGQTQTTTSARPINLGANKIIVGSSHNANSALFQNPVDIAMVAIYSVSKTDTQIAEIYRVMRSYFGKRGISI